LVPPAPSPRFTSAFQQITTNLTLDFTAKQIPVCSRIHDILLISLLLSQPHYYAARTTTSYTHPLKIKPSLFFKRLDELRLLLTLPILEKIVSGLWS
jgi:hypothetical protein